MCGDCRARDEVAAHVAQDGAQLALQAGADTQLKGILRCTDEPVVLPTR